MTRVLAFMCSRHRPLMLRSSILQIAAQSYPLDCAVYINSDTGEAEKTDYRALVDDIKFSNNKHLFLNYGKSLRQHANYIAALDLVDINDYDIFLKIDDDDVYRLDYVNDIVEDFEKNSWDLSGESAIGIINGPQWAKDLEMKNMGLKEGEFCVGVAATWAFSRKAIKLIKNLSGDTPYFEDRYWKDNLEQHKDIKLHRRHSLNSNYCYHIHGQNSSTASWLDKGWADRLSERNNIERPDEVLTSFQATAVAFDLFKKSVPLLPKDIYHTLRSKLRFLFS